VLVVAAVTIVVARFFFSLRSNEFPQNVVLGSCFLWQMFLLRCQNCLLSRTCMKCVGAPVRTVKGMRKSDIAQLLSNAEIGRSYGCSLLD
jgi:hypothetical protein